MPSENSKSDETTGKNTSKTAAEVTDPNGPINSSEEPKSGFNGAENVVDISAESSETSAAPVDDLQTQLEKASKDFLYLRAEFENYKRNAIKERVALQKFGPQRLALDLLPVVDVFEQALGEVNTDSENDPFVKGILMTQKELNQALEKHGIKKISAIGETFNPEVHEALGTEPSQTYKEGEICRVFKSPYKFHDKLLRPGQVFVATAPAEKDENP